MQAKVEDSEDEDTMYAPEKKPRAERRTEKRAVPIRRGRTAEKDRRMPVLEETSCPTRHSSKEIARDKFGEPDPWGINDEIWTETKKKLGELDERLAEIEEIEEQSLKRTSDLRQRWFERCKDIMRGILSELPLLRGINHRIPLINEKMKYNYHLPRCAEVVKPVLMEKIRRYTNAGWWRRATVTQAAPMLCIPKKNGSLRIVVDSRKRNENTERNVTPFPDQDQIRMDVARAKIRLKIDLADAYEQVRVDPDDVWKTAFATVYGTLQVPLVPHLLGHNELSIFLT